MGKDKKKDKRGLKVTRNQAVTKSSIGMGRTNVTIQQVAERAGVSTMTVSRTLRNPGVVAEKTRGQVQEAIDELNYIPDLSAIAMSSKQGTTVAVILPSLSFEGHVRTVDGLSSELKKRGFHLFISDNFYSQQQEIDVLRVVLGHRPAGIVMINSAHSAAGRELILKSGVPVIETWELPNVPIDSVVGFSHHKVGFELTEHLLACGYQRLAFVGSAGGVDRRANERLQGFIDCLKQYNKEHHRHVTVAEAPVSVAAGKEGVSRVLEEFPDTEAILTLTDRVAMGAMMECRRRGISVPDELAIAGHGGFDFSEHLAPSLTTTRVDGFKIGTEAARLLMDKVTGDTALDESIHIDVGFDVVVRESTLGNAANTVVLDDVNLDKASNDSSASDASGA